MTALFIMFTLMIDMFVSSIVFSDFSLRGFVFVPSTTLLFLLFILMHQKEQKVFLWGMISGLLIDLINHSMLFSHALVFLIILFVLKEYQRHFSDTFIEIILMGLIAIFLKEVVFMLWYMSQGVFQLSLLSWYAVRLFVTMMGNIPLIWIAYLMSLKYQKTLKKQKIKMQRSESHLWAFIRE